jgi:5-carboxymethyl-2-hydroxymuconate isomerase
MPQLTLTLSQNINVTLINFKRLFEQIHDALRSIPKMDVNTAHSGIIQETYSYIGFDNPNATKVYLQLYWMEDKERLALKPALGKKLLQILENSITSEVEAQGLICIPRVRIANLGNLNQEYFISGKY